MTRTGTVRWTWLLPIALAAAIWVAVPSSAKAPPPGAAGATLTLDSSATFRSIDAATDKHGTTYVGWISRAGGTAPPLVHLCVLPLGATACKGGVQSTSSLDSGPAVSANGLSVLYVQGQMFLLWLHDTPASDDDPMGARFGFAAVTPQGVLAGATDFAVAAPSGGRLTSATVTPAGRMSAVVVGSPTLNGQGVDYFATMDGPAQELSAPFVVGNAQVADDGHHAVVTVSESGAVNSAVQYAYRKDDPTIVADAFSDFTKVPGTWTRGNIERLVHTGAGIRLVSSTNHPSYRPVVARWRGAKFAAPVATGDHDPCGPTSHDVVTDASRRLADVAIECGKLAVANLPGATRAATVRIGAGGTIADPPQISTTAGGRGWVVWSTTGTVADKLVARPIRLPSLTRTVKAHNHAGRLRLSGPVSCLPVVGVHVGLTVTHAKHWRVKSRRVRVGGKRIHGIVNGAALAAQHTYALHARVVFKRHRHGKVRRKILRRKLTFSTCARP